MSRRDRDTIQSIHDTRVLILGSQRLELVGTEDVVMTGGGISKRLWWAATCSCGQRFQTWSWAFRLWKFARSGKPRLCDRCRPRPVKRAYKGGRA
jgi:hypothetical protein